MGGCTGSGPLDDTSPPPLGVPPTPVGCRGSRTLHFVRDTHRKRNCFCPISRSGDACVRPKKPVNTTDGGYFLETRPFVPQQQEARRVGFTPLHATGTLSGEETASLGFLLPLKKLPGPEPARPQQGRTAEAATPRRIPCALNPFLLLEKGGVRDHGSQTSWPATSRRRFCRQTRFLGKTQVNGHGAVLFIFPIRLAARLFPGLVEWPHFLLRFCLTTRQHLARGRRCSFSVFITRAGRRFGSSATAVSSLEPATLRTGGRPPSFYTVAVRLPTWVVDRVSRKHSFEAPGAAEGGPEPPRQSHC